jgi:hypothetical protein
VPDGEIRSDASDGGTALACYRAREALVDVEAGEQRRRRRAARELLHHIGAVIELALGRAANGLRMPPSDRVIGEARAAADSGEPVAGVPGGAAAA